MNKQISICGYACTVPDVQRTANKKAVSIILAYILEDCIKYVPVITSDMNTAQIIQKGARLNVCGHIREHTYLAKDFTRVTVQELIADVIQRI